MDVLDRATGELRDMEQQRLFGEWEEVTTYEINLTGSGLQGDETLEVGQEVRLEVLGRVVAIQQLVRLDPDDPVKEREILVRRAVVKAHSAKVRA